ncbi:MAG: BTAD domain-containing putative transcriptional regulator [Pseudonocardiaceae bacterium]
MTALEFRVLGPFEVVGDGRPLDVGPAKQRALLAMLLVHANTVVSTDRLLDGLWSGEPPVNARHALQVYVSNLRKLLEPGRSPGGNGQVLVTRQPGYLLQVASERLDAARFERLVTNGRRALADGRAGEAAELLRAALGMWRGPALADLVGLPFARVPIGRWEQLRLQALEARVDADLALGRHLDVVGELAALVTMHPLRERFWFQLMLALYRASSQGEALQAYQAARELLVEQLGIDPGVEMRQLHAAILRQDPMLAPSAVAAGARCVTTPNNLPAQLSSFIGRERELMEVCQLLETTRLVTLTGVGEAGKSRLALEVAAARLPHHPDGVWLVELASVAEPSLVVHTVATILGVWEHPARPLTDLLAQHLRMAEVLLVLDNCEHLVEGVAGLAERLIAACAGLRVLTTSRERLGITSEVLYPVSGLGVPQLGAPEASVVERADALRLFVERASAVQPSFRLSDETAGVVARICRSLDGLPLAIELAATRVNTLGVEHIAERLGDRYWLLAQGSRTALARHQTLRAVVDWSYGLLSESERRLFDRLAVFIGGFTLEAAEAVCPELGEEEVVELLSRLVDKSLVTVQTAELPTCRYHLLETLRAYGLQCLDNRGETKRLRARHAVIFVALAELAGDGLRGPEQPAWLDRLETEHANLRAALEWWLKQGDAETAVRMAGSLYQFWGIHGYYTEGRQWLARALATDGQVPAAAQARALLGAATLAVIQGDFQEAMVACEQAAGLCRHTGDTAGLAHALQYLGFVAIYTEELDRAVELLDESVHLARRAGAAWIEGRSLIFIATVALARGEQDQAAELLDACEALLGPLGDREAMAWALLVRGGIAWRQGDDSQGAAALRAGLQAFQSINGRWGLALGLYLAAQLTRARSHWRQATRLFGASQAMHAALGAVLMPFFDVWLDEAVTETSAALGTQAFQHAWQAGQTLSPNAAVDEAIRELGAVAPVPAGRRWGGPGPSLSSLAVSAMCRHDEGRAGRSALPCHMVSNMVTTMATKQVTITVDEDLLSWFEHKAAQTGGKLSPTIARAARNWMLWEDAARLAEADQRTGCNATDYAEAELAAQREAEATEGGRGHAA